MMFPFLGEEELDILTSEVKIIDGIEQVRVYAESPDRTTGKFKKLEMYLPKDNITFKQRSLLRFRSKAAT